MATTQINEQNPIGLDGVDFVEYSGPDMSALDRLFRRMGFKEIASLPNTEIRLFRQGQINFILNTEHGTFAKDFSKLHGPCISAVGFRVFDAQHAFKTAVARGAKPFEGGEKRLGATPFPAVYGIGDSLIIFVDQQNANKLYNQTFKIHTADQSPVGFGLKTVDHFTNNVPRGDMEKWCVFYEKIFNFKRTLTFDIRGQKTGLESKVMRSPCGKFSVPINEPTDSKSQIQEYLEEYKGSGVQHLALTTDNIIETLETMKASEIAFLSPPPKTYYAALKDRVPHVLEDIDRLERNAILVDGDHHGYLLQIFTKNVIGPIFYELIQRRGHEGFGEGNFQALFDAIERDQRERGYLD